jgi:hypothetical protein
MTVASGAEGTNWWVCENCGDPCDAVAIVNPSCSSCDWEENEDGWWNTDCGNAFEFTDGSPIYNEFKCCPYCGKTLTETPYSEDDDSSANSQAQPPKVG